VVNISHTFVTAGFFPKGDMPSLNITNFLITLPNYGNLKK
jgi:hypothetical protein